jgi:type II secretory pathway pseudopilin PulG
MNNNRKYRGFLTIEVITSLLLVILLTAALATAMRFYSIANRSQLARQRCLSAVQAQLDSIMVQKKQLSQDDIQRLWPGVVCVIEKQPGQESWKGLDLYTITATTKIRNREIYVRMNRYIQSGDQ